MRQRVLITAGGAGIGRAMANAFADRGADVWVTDVDADVLADCPLNWQVSAVSAADEVGMAAVFSELADRWGGVDVICANAGIAGLQREWRRSRWTIGVRVSQLIWKGRFWRVNTQPR